MARTDPKKTKDPKKPGRVFKNRADLGRQRRLEGQDTPFQRRLRLAEFQGEDPFDYEGKSYAANIDKSVGTRRARLTPRTSAIPELGIIKKRPGVIPNPAIEPVIPPVVNTAAKLKASRRRRNSGIGIVNNRFIGRVSATGERPGSNRGGRTRGNKGRRIK